MTVMDGQMDIFDQLNDVRTVTCPHCGVSWRPGTHLDDDEAIEVHTRRKDSMWDGWPGECTNQRMTLGWLHQRIAHPRLPMRIDLIGLLAQTVAQRIDTAHVLGVLAMAEKQVTP